MERRNYGLSREEFCATWNQAGTANEATAKLTALCQQKGTLKADEAMKKTVVLARVANYRKKGVHLKEMPRGRAGSNQIDVVSLNTMLDNLVVANAK